MLYQEKVCQALVLSNNPVCTVNNDVIDIEDKNGNNVNQQKQRIEEEKSSESYFDGTNIIFHHIELT